MYTPSQEELNDIDEQLRTYFSNKFANLLLKKIDFMTLFKLVVTLQKEDEENSEFDFSIEINRSDKELILIFKFPTEVRDVYRGYHCRNFKITRTYKYKYQKPSISQLN